MGMKHCGKSTLGRMLAERRSAAFYDLDELTAEIIGAEGGVSIREFYRARGEEAFRLCEAEAARKLAGLCERDRHIVAALGGGTIENEAAMERLSHAGMFVYLESPPEVLFRRIAAGGLPPFLPSERPYEAFLELYERRTALYRQRADLTVQLGELGPLEAIMELTRVIEECEHGRK
jgi:shikimate kinase